VATLCNILSLMTLTLPPGVISSASWHRTNITLAGLFPLDTSLGWGVLKAAILALNHVNADDSVLPGYQLVMKWNDTKVGTTFILFF
jgi:hypothetical protein